MKIRKNINEGHDNIHATNMYVIANDICTHKDYQKHVLHYQRFHMMYYHEGACASYFSEYLETLKFINARRIRLISIRGRTPVMMFPLDKFQPA